MYKTYMNRWIKGSFNFLMTALLKCVESSNDVYLMSSSNLSNCLALFMQVTMKCSFFFICDAFFSQNRNLFYNNVVTLMTLRYHHFLEEATNWSKLLSQNIYGSFHQSQLIKRVILQWKICTTFTHIIQTWKKIGPH